MERQILFYSRNRKYDQPLSKNENQDMDDRRKMNQEETRTCDTLATIDNHVYGKRD